MCQEEEEEGEEEEREEQDTSSSSSDSSDSNDSLPPLPFTITIPQKRNKQPGPKKSTSKSIRGLKLYYTDQLTEKKAVSSIRNEEEEEEEQEQMPEEEVVAPQIDYQILIFSLVELAKPKTRRDKVCMLMLSADMEWIDVYAMLKVKAVDVLFPGQDVVRDDAIEITFTIPRIIKNPLPLSSSADYKYIIKNTVSMKTPAANIVIKQVTQAAGDNQVWFFLPGLDTGSDFLTEGGRQGEYSFAAAACHRKWRCSHSSKENHWQKKLSKFNDIQVDSTMLQYSSIPYLGA